MSLTRPLVLASQSPRRREILTRLGLTFTVTPAHVDETRLAGEAPGDYVTRLALAKARAIAATHASACAVLGSDTTVAFDDVVLEKPRDRDDNARMIAALSGREHTVFTGVALVLAPEGSATHVTVATRVRFRELGARTIAAYAASGEGADKAGGYGIQDLGAALVSEVHGSYTNVVGLPAAETITLLEAARLLPVWP